MRFGISKSIQSIILSFTLSHSISTQAAEHKGTILIDGSSTVAPLSEAVAEEFQKANKGIRVTVGTSGTGGGFKKFINGETDINDASRLIKDSTTDKNDEADSARNNKVDFLALAIAIDGISVVVHKSSKIESLTLAQLKSIWEPNSKIKLWSDLDPKWPATNIKLYGPGPDSGTFDYFTEAVVGKAKQSRNDYSASEDDNTLVSGISRDPNSLGYFGYEYYAMSQSIIKALSINGGKGPVEPSEQTIVDKSYPLSRPLYIYVSKKSSSRPEVAAFIEYYLGNANKLAKQIGIVAFPEKHYQDELKKWKTWNSKK